VAVGSGSQLTSFTYTKRFVNATMPDGHWFVATATSACVASVFVCVFMSPFDVAATRVYNQPIDKVSFKKQTNKMQGQHKIFSMEKEHFTMDQLMPL